MAEIASSETGSPEEGTLTVVTVPEDQAEAVIEFVKSLQIKATDVSGHMIAGGGLLGGGGGALPWASTGTGCNTVFTGKKTDTSCSDNDNPKLLG